MDSTENRYWPFDVLPPEKQTMQHRREVRFLEAAYQAGFKPYMFGSQNFGATAERRGGEIIYRGCGGKHWEMLLVAGPELVVTAHVNDFERAAEALLRWLHGDGGAVIIEYVRAYLLSTPSTPSGYVLHSQEG